MTIDAASGANPYAGLIANSDMLTQTEAAKNAGKTDTSAVAQKKTKDDKDMFLKLLVAQLRYQDPSKPADTTQFMAQTAQFSALEAMQEVATTSSSMVAAQNKLQASTLVGQTVSYTAEDGKTKTGEVRSVSFIQDSAGGTNGEPVLNVDGVSVVLSKIGGVGNVGATAAATTTSTTPASSTTGTPAAGSTTNPTSGSTSGSATSGSTKSA